MFILGSVAYRLCSSVPVTAGTVIPTASETQRLSTEVDACHRLRFASTSDRAFPMHQIRFRLGLCPDPAGGAYSAPQIP